MVSDILKSAKDAIKSMWSGLCTVYKNEKSKNKYGISFENVSQADQTELGANVSQVVTLFISPEVYIPPGSMIEVTQNNVTRTYKHSGISAIYTNHQEIILELEQEKA